MPERGSSRDSNPQFYKNNFTVELRLTTNPLTRPLVIRVTLFWPEQKLSQSVSLIRPIGYRINSVSLYLRRSISENQHSSWSNMMLKAQDGSTVCIEPNLPSNTTRYVSFSCIRYQCNQSSILIDFYA